ncbi:MAG: glycosyltransferase [Sporichthyaceae bacterium]
MNALRLAARAALVAGTGRAIVQAGRIARNARRTPAPPAHPPTVTERVSVLMPARNEAHRIAPGIRSLVAQRGCTDLEIIVLDDNSTDATSDVVLEAAGGDPRLRVISGRALPEGWRGKPHACSQLGETANGSVLIFVDADVEFAPHAMAASVALMRERHLDYVSPFPRQLTGSVAERLMQPLTAWVRLGMVDMRHAEDSHEHGSLLANGQFLVIDAEAYRRAGGHEAIKDALIDDVWMAAALKITGSRGVAVEGSGVASCRMYTSWTEMRDGYTRWLWVLFPKRRNLVWTCAKMIVTDVVPPLAALRGSRIGLLGYLAAVSGRVISGRAARDCVVPDALAAPISSALSVGLYLDSVRRQSKGAVSWKGRAIP